MEVGPRAIRRSEPIDRMTSPLAQTDRHKQRVQESSRVVYRYMKALLTARDLTSIAELGRKCYDIQERREILRLEAQKGHRRDSLRNLWPLSEYQTRRRRSYETLGSLVLRGLLLEEDLVVRTSRNFPDVCQNLKWETIDKEYLRRDGMGDRQHTDSGESMGCHLIY